MDCNSNIDIRGLTPASTRNDVEKAHAFLEKALAGINLLTEGYPGQVTRFARFLDDSIASMSRVVQYACDTLAVLRWE